MAKIIYEGDAPHADEHYEDGNAKSGVRLGAVEESMRWLIDRGRYLFLGIRRFLDTLDFSDQPDYLYKLETVRNWSRAPCGSTYSDYADFSDKHLQDVERYRYTIQDWLLQDIRSFDVRGKRLLEIGYGMGTDHAQLGKKGALLHGIDLTPINSEVAVKRLALDSLHSDLLTGDAEVLPYPDEYFDFVYSFGVVHHSPNTEQIIDEIHRVLRPGGRCYVTVYHKNSIFFWWTVFVMNFLLRGGWRRRTLKQQLSLIEAPNTNEKMVIRLYTRKEFERLFRKFYEVHSYIRHLVPLDVDLGFRVFRHPERHTRFFDWLGNRWGWYVVIQACKKATGRGSA